MPRHYDITVEIDGRRCSGTWSIKQGAKICVASAWGADTVDCGALRPEDCARQALTRIVRADLKRRADLAKQRERELARVNRYWDKQKLRDDHA